MVVPSPVIRVTRSNIRTYHHENSMNGMANSARWTATSGDRANAIRARRNQLIRAAPVSGVADRAVCMEDFRPRGDPGVRECGTGRIAESSLGDSRPRPRTLAFEVSNLEDGAGYADRTGLAGCELFTPSGSSPWGSLRGMYHASRARELSVPRLRE